MSLCCWKRSLSQMKTQITGWELVTMLSRGNYDCSSKAWLLIHSRSSQNQRKHTQLDGRGLFWSDIWPHIYISMYVDVWERSISRIYQSGGGDGGSVDCNLQRHHMMHCCSGSGKVFLATSSEEYEIMNHQKTFLDKYPKFCFFKVQFLIPKFSNVQ